jgi:hypothetical protein
MLHLFVGTLQNVSNIYKKALLQSYFPLFPKKKEKTARKRDVFCITF